MKGVQLDVFQAVAPALRLALCRGHCDVSAAAWANRLTPFDWRLGARMLHMRLDDCISLILMSC